MINAFLRLPGLIAALAAAHPAVLALSISAAGVASWATALYVALRREARRRERINRNRRLPGSFPGNNR